jgi:hypothetical protein
VEEAELRLDGDIRAFEAARAEQQAQLDEDKRKVREHAEVWGGSILVHHQPTLPCPKPSNLPLFQRLLINRRWLVFITLLTEYTFSRAAVCVFRTARRWRSTAR